MSEATAIDPTLETIERAIATSPAYVAKFVDPLPILAEAEMWRACLTREEDR